MNHHKLRPLNGGDREQVIGIWQRSFGDSPALIEGLLDGCGLIRRGVGCEMDGLIRSCMFIFDGIDLGGRRAAYLYALCTQPGYRGLGFGREVCMYAASTAAAGGAELVFLRPGSPELERWYADTMGARSLCRSGTRPVRPLSAPAGEPAVPISAAEYLSARPAGGWQPGSLLMEAQAVIMASCGGAFLRARGGIVCAEKTTGGILIRELISPRPEETLAAAAEHFGVKALDVLSENPDGLPLMALPVGRGGFPSAPLPPLPFTLD